ncbi:YceD family protein [Microbacterium sp. W1N]|uniref:YceD family protein n=1 Tax=Microbacterium festucae TaxID=2977531 RepID=UPI0021C087D0|nr:YceD family protein [Microbacterium festucae]MCT9820335.1 YceD family protein [Microbacterium festucae]
MNSPFLIPVREIAHRSGEMREHDIEVAAPEQWGEGLVSVPQGEPVQIDVRLESVHEGILVTAEVATRMVGVCGRCLTDIAQPVEVEFQELFGYPGGEANDFEVQDDHVDLETPVRDSIVLSLPFQPVCQPDCPGLDPSTGVKLTDSAEPETPIDPRWAALQALTPDHDDTAQRRAADDTEKS